MRGRVDVNRYTNGVQTLKNFIIMPQGGVYRRPGTKYIGEVKTSSNFTRLVSFEFSTVQAYVLEFGDLYIRIYRDGGLVTSGGSPVEVVTPYTTAQLPDLQFTQSADILYIVHPNLKPRKLSRTSHTTWTLTEFEFLDGPYLSPNKTSTTLNPSATTGNITITASANVFASTDVGRLIRFGHNNGTKNGSVKITGFTSATSVTATVQNKLDSATAVTDWRLGAWSQTTGYPASVVFFQERLVFGYTDNQPQTIWMSCSGDYENFQPTGEPGGTYPVDATVSDDNSIVYTLASNKVNAIRWLDAGSNLVIGTTGAEWIAKQASTADPLSPTNIQVLQQTTYGSDAVPARRIGTATLFIQRSGRKIRELIYNFDVDSYIARDISILSEHLLRENNYTTDNAFQQEPDSVFWVVTQTGKLIGMTYLREQEVVGFHQHNFGGVFSSGDAVVESVAVVPNADLTGDQLYLIIKRTINGNTKRYVEVIQNPFEPTTSTDKTNMWFVDSGLRYTGAPTTTITGLSHLEGQTVAIVADGAQRPSLTVSSGSITLSRSASDVIVGLNYTSTIKTLPFEGGGQAGTAQGKQARIHKVTIRLLNSLTFKHGVSLTNLDLKEFRQAGDPMDESPPLFTGDKSFSLNQSYTTDTSYYIVQDLPYPLTVIAIMPESVVYK